MDDLSGANAFLSLDLTSGYHQLVLHPTDCKTTAFNTQLEKHVVKVPPMGLSNATAMFQATMNKLFSPCLNEFVCVYLDDILDF
jgi:hypothetical protein